MSVISSDLQEKVNNSLKMSPIMASQITGRAQFTSPLGSQIFSPDGSSTVEGVIQPSGFVDMSSFRFEGDLDHSDGIYLSKSIQSTVQRLQVYSPITGEHIIDIENFNVLQAALSDVTFTPFQMEEGSLSSTQLYGSTETRKKFSKGVSFSMQLNHDLFRMSSYLPSFLCGGLKIKITLAPTATAFIKSDPAVTTTTYSLSNLVCCYDVVSVTPAVQSQYIAGYNNNSLQVRIPTWRVSSFTSDAQIESVRVTNLGNSNRALLMVPRMVSTVNNPSADSLGRRTANTLKQLSVKIGDAVARTHNTTKGAASLVALLQQAIDNTSSDTSINAKNYHCALPYPPGSIEDLDRSSKFMLLQSLELDNTDNSVLSGISRQDITVNLEYKDPLPGQVLYTSYVLIDQIITMGKDVLFKVLA